ncbi:Protein detoxification 45, chloroplastic [Vitis vinifera]|uniref:Protein DETOXIFICATION n=1 Tax=Vitis vinifera TaxID=29760 RepID=A0A438JSY8_VITVI|nr:Protein detoxification 45, chloroplastic [Vitis vinifera]
MAVMQLNGGVLATGLTSTGSGGGVIKKITGSSVVVQPSGEHNAFALIKSKGLRYEDVTRCHHQSLDLLRPFSPLVTCRRKHVFPVFNNHLGSDCGVDSSEVEENIVVEKGNDIGKSSEVRKTCMQTWGTFFNLLLWMSLVTHVELKGITATLSRSLGVKRELIMLSLPAMAGQALDPLAQLMETAYIGRLVSCTLHAIEGFVPVELASAGVSISIFNIISKLFNIPLLSISTSFVAEDISKNAINNSASEEFYQEESTNGTPFVGVTERMQLSSVSTALLLAVGIGIFEAFALYFGSGWFLNLMGIPLASSMHAPARRFLSLRALGAPAVVVSLALQGILRGFKDTKTPVLCLGKSLVYLALLCKWSWRFAVERDSYWKLIISTKFGIERGGWSTRGVREGYGVGLWKEISKEGLLLLNNVSFSVGNGKRVRFWKDIWCGNISLCEAFPSLYDLAVSKDAWVADCWDSTGEEGGWTPRFLRPFNDWEMEEVERFLSTIQGKRLNADVEDRMVWKETKNEIFTVMSLYNSLDHSSAVLFPWKIIWCPYVPTKVGCFAWEASWGKLLTQDQLKRRGWYLANRCSLCCVEEETINHILIHCSKAKILWDLVFSLFGVNWVLPLMARNTLLGGNCILPVCSGSPFKHPLSNISLCYHMIKCQVHLSPCDANCMHWCKNMSASVNVLRKTKLISF